MSLRVATRSRGVRRVEVDTMTFLLSLHVLYSAPTRECTRIWTEGEVKFLQIYP